MNKILFDSHCHLYDSHYDENKEDLIREIQASDIRFLTDIGTDYFTWLKVLEDIEKYDFCYGTVGCYPEDTGLCPADIHAAMHSGEKAGEIPEDRLKELESMSLSEYESIASCWKGEKLSSNKAPVMSEELLSLMADIYSKNEKIVAIGEIGLDYHDPAWYPPRQLQRYWFIRQLELAVRLGAPVCIHTRDADEETFNILKEHALGKTRVLLHCYSGSAQLAKEYVKHGAMISLSGTLTYRNARKTVETAEAIPLESLLIETDAPYLTPVPKRGQTNKPNYVAYTCAKLAQIKGISYEEAGKITAENAMRFYGIQDKIK